MPRRRPPPEQQPLFAEPDSPPESVESRPRPTPERNPVSRPGPTPDHDPEPRTEESPFPRPQYGRPSPLDNLPDVRDGLNRKERIILFTLHEAQKERRGRYVSTAMLYGRVVERIDMSVEEFQRILQRMVGVQGGQSTPRPSPFSGHLPDEDDDPEKR